MSTPSSRAMRRTDGAAGAGGISGVGGLGGRPRAAADVDDLAAPRACGAVSIVGLRWCRLRRLWRGDAAAAES